MEATTPSRPALQGENSAYFTRPQDPESPSNLHAAKRRKDQHGHQQPPHPTLGSESASAAIQNQLDEADRKARVRREVLGSLAETVDKFVADRKQPDERALAQNICERFIEFITMSDYADTNGADRVPTRVRSSQLPAIF
ncbi:uncharacterized protein N7515_004988 [Penicillium bovifimosum]|uniref:Uncharacterized protein n=1 Tax=Penicillium bovifimosum TaxID=126998 RepID=A0A9W9H1G4_9EURO|nr:uncharacterized protein N7515_004988 [Penicillium bovifimosum]KAJ5135710.1 hypothetical protein N7515_004988 [Penicillium bovifimosum]